MRDWVGDRHSVLVTLGARNEAKAEREEDDFYATDPIAAEELIRIEELPDNIWECACGAGHLAKVFSENGFNVRATDLVDRGYGKAGVDFLKQTEKYDGAIVTNPPYKYALEFVRKALELVDDGQKVCMFLKIQFLETAKRRELFDTMQLKTVHVATHRIPCGRGGRFDPNGGLCCYAWYVWEKGYCGDPVIKWFN